jgi:hypothetical protein
MKSIKHKNSRLKSKTLKFRHIKGGVNTPVPTKVLTPQTEPILTPVEEPIKTPLVTPVEESVATKVPTPVEESVATKVPTPVEEPVETKVPTPVEEPVETKVPTPVEEPTTAGVQSNEVTIKLDKETLKKIAISLNQNIIINIASYIDVLTKLVDTETDNNVKQQLRDNLTTLKQLNDSTGTLYTDVQKTLGVSEEQIQKPEDVAQTQDQSGFLKGLQSVEMAAILGTLVPAAVMIGGKKTKRSKKSNKKKTKRSSKK